MMNLFCFVLFGAVALASFTACQRTADEVVPIEVLPITVLGEWRLVAFGGGITGKMDPVPAGRESRAVFGSDSAYVHYENGQQVEATTFRLVQRHTSEGPDEQLVLIKSFHAPAGRPYYRSQYVTLLTPTVLHLSTGGGCALNSEYVRVGRAAPSAKQ